MAEHTALSPEILLHIAQTLNLPLRGITAVIELLDDGGTVPFIARYRKEATGNLDEVQIRDIADKLAYFRDLVDRRATILASIAEQGKLTDHLKDRINATLDKTELEDLYLPYKPKRRTKATIAREKGLEPLADYLWNQEPAAQALADYAATFVNAELGVANVDEALEGARHIIAERISEDAAIRKDLRQLMFDEGTVVSRKVYEDPEAKTKLDEQEKFKMYNKYSEPVKTIPSHRMLAIRRGEVENVLYFLIELDPERALGIMRRHIFSRPESELRVPQVSTLRPGMDITTNHRVPPVPTLGPGIEDIKTQLNLSVEDAWKRLLNSSIQGEIRLELKRRSDTEAIQVFKDNLVNVLLAPPAGPISVLGIDPGLRTGCKVAVVDETGKLLDHDVLYLHTSKRGDAEATPKLEALLRKHTIRAIAIGNGTASRETDAFVRGFLKEKGIDGIFSVTVSEAGASVYSASEVARQEFPDLDLTVRGAISIARRLQDPLSELVKVDPKSIGVGQYQHDVDQRQLAESLEAVVESCVNRVGVDLNTSSWTLLRRVAGLSERTALNLVAYRDQNGAYTSRQQVLKVPGIGPKTFEQAAGFLRIRNGENPLDSTAVHPESYPIVEKIAAELQTTIPELIKNPRALDSKTLEKAKLGDLGADSYTLQDILNELRKPGRDPRDKFVAPSFHDDVKEIADVKVGMVLEGVVTNVTKFGAFVDIGVHQDGLVHISELSNKFIKDPNEAVKTGQIVKVKVLTVEEKAKRIGLSMKALLPGSQSGQRPAPSGAQRAAQAGAQPSGNRPNQQRGGNSQQKPKPAPAPQSMEDKLAALNNKWKVRV